MLLNVFDDRGRQLDSYCRLSAERMLYFIVEVIGEAPAGIYVELFDRLTRRTYRSDVFPLKGR